MVIRIGSWCVLLGKGVAEAPPRSSSEPTFLGALREEGLRISTDDAGQATCGDLAAWMVGACPPEQRAAAERHVRSCRSCAGDMEAMEAAVSWLGVGTPVTPPPSLRSRVLTAARRTRHSPGWVRTALIEPYLLQVEALDDLLAELAPAQWASPVPRHGDVAGLIGHLASNDAMVLGDLGVPVGAAAAATPRRVEAGGSRRRWRDQSALLVAEVRDSSADRFEQPVRLAGRRPVSRSLREGMVQRAFETWIHAEDVRTALGRPHAPPPPRHLRSIVDLAVGLLPNVMAVAGRDHPGQVARLRLTGPEDGEWCVRLGARSDPDATPAVGIEAELAQFCQLLAGRRTRYDLDHTISGDRRLAVDLLDVAATLGCD
jgi:uncharacterized protein (TIGR03083 family)